MTRAIGCCLAVGFVASLALAGERKPPISQEPKPLGTARGYTDYRPQPPARVRDEVLRVANNGSFVSRCLLVISCAGSEKNFETITGQDGLTFGITDFATDDGVYDFMKLLSQSHPQEFNIAFGEHAKNLVDRDWIKQNNGGGRGSNANDNGLIRFDWLRRGLDQILTNPHLYGMQLENFKLGKVDPCLNEFKKNHFQLEFTLGSMIGVANSAGPGGMHAFLEKAKQSVPQEAADREILIAKQMLFLYASKDPSPGPADAVYLSSNFTQNPAGALGHRADRVYRLVRNFPPDKKQPFVELGEFSLEPEQQIKVAGAVSAASATPEVRADQTAAPPESEKTTNDAGSQSATVTLAKPKQTLRDKFPANEETRKWLKKVEGADLEQDARYTFPELAGKTSCMLKVKKEEKTFGSFLPPGNSSGNPNTEIAYFNTARFLGFEHIIRPAAAFRLGPRAILAFKGLLESEQSKNEARNANRRAIVDLIQKNPNEMLGAFKADKPKGIQEYNPIGTNDPNLDDSLMQLVRADQPMPAAGTTVSIKINGKTYKAQALDTGRNLANLLTLDVIFAQYDRFSGGNFTVRTHEDGTFSLFSTDNGGAELDPINAKKILTWFSRYDPGTIARLKEMSAFLSGKQSNFLGYTEPEKFVIDLGLYLEHSPAQYVKKLSRNCDLLLAAVTSNAASHGEKNTFFAASVSNN